MICPECKSEYRQGFLTCADCGVELVPALAPDAPPESHTDEAQHEYADYSDLLATMDPSYVSFIRSVLDGEGIDHYVLGEHTSLAFMIPVQQIVRVRQDQIERAREILDDIENGSSPEVS
ncbi:MAG: DUF2007 domain-containing protein [Thermodesulfovibrionales bacterium]|nr:DUF2007 domain-containing protein [Thermodesulfovibrionales bacterium]